MFCSCSHGWSKVCRASTARIVQIHPFSTAIVKAYIWSRLEGYASACCTVVKTKDSIPAILCRSFGHIDRVLCIEVVNIFSIEWVLFYRQIRSCSKDNFLFCVSYSIGYFRCFFCKRTDCANHIAQVDVCLVITCCIPPGTISKVKCICGAI